MQTKKYRVQYKLSPEDVIETFRYQEGLSEEDVKLKLKFEDEVTHNNIVFTKIEQV